MPRRTKKRGWIGPRSVWTEPLRNASVSGLSQNGLGPIWIIKNPTEGRLEIVTDAGQDAVDAACQKTNDVARGRRSRVVLTPRRWRQASRKCPRGDGGKQARSPGRARRKPLKPLRAGMPGDPGATVVTNARAYYSPRAAAGATGTRHSPLPPWGSAHALSWADRSGRTRAQGAAGM